MSKDELIERLANLVVAETPIEQIVLVLELSESEISQLKTTPECRRQIAIAMGEKIEEEQNLNCGWDAVEATAINIVIDNLKWNKDPRFALAAAAQANKAVRRGISGNKALNAVNGTRAVISLQMNFIKHLESATQDLATIDHKDMERKLIDCMEPAKLESILQTTPETKEDVLVGVEIVI